MRLTKDQLWDRIADLDWAGENKGKPFDYNERQKYGFNTAYGTKGMEAIQHFARDRVAELYNAVGDYQIEHGVESLRFDCSSDSINDLFWHVVGLGKFIFEQNLKNPKLLEERYQCSGYEEGFAYVFHKPEPPKSKRQKRIERFQRLIKTQAEMRSAIRDLEKQSLQIERELTEICAEFQGE
jgi:hypothetical protein